jgi:hypothetical protein
MPNTRELGWKGEVLLVLFVAAIFAGILYLTPACVP